jgi:hypothetical protein
MKGTVIDFLSLAGEKPELAKDLVELAAKYDFEFTSDELSDAELDAVAGGASAPDATITAGSDGQLANIDIQDMLQKQQQLVQMLSNVSKLLNDTASAVIRKIG